MQKSRAQISIKDSGFTNPGSLLILWLLILGVKLRGTMTSGRDTATIIKKKLGKLHTNCIYTTIKMKLKYALSFPDHRD